MSQTYYYYLLQVNSNNLCITMCLYGITCSLGQLAALAAQWHLSPPHPSSPESLHGFPT